MFTPNQAHCKLLEISCPNRPTAATFTQDGKQILYGDNSDGMLRRWQIDDGREISTSVKTGGHVYDIKMSNDGRWMVLAEGQMVVVRDARTNATALEVEEHRGHVGAIGVSADSTKFASGSEDDTAYVFSITTGKKLLGPLRHDIDVIGIKFSPSGKLIATATPVSVCIWDANVGAKLVDIPVVSVSHPIAPFAWSSDSKNLFAATPGRITCIDVPTSARSFSWSLKGHDPKPPTLVTNGRFVACYTGATVSFLDISSRQRVGSTIKFPVALRSIALSSDGNRLVCGRVDNIISVHTLIGVLPQHVLLDPARSLPLMNITDAGFKPWIEHDTIHAEVALSQEVMSSKHSHNTFANRALVRARLHQWDAAIIDAKQSLAIQPSPIGHIAMALALVGKGERRLALRTVDLVFRDCSSTENGLLLLIKAALSFLCGRHQDAILRISGLMETADSNAAYCCIQVLANMYVQRGDYEHAMQALQRGPSIAPPSANGPLATMSLVFGWIFQGLDIVIYQHQCQSLYAAKRISEGAEYLLTVTSTFGNEAHASKANVNWINDFTTKYALALEGIGDGEFNSEKYGDAVAHYSLALSLDPPSKASLLVKRSRARAAMGLWLEALDDANVAINEDPSRPWGYDRRHSAYHGMQLYDEAIDTLSSMLTVIERSPDPKIRDMFQNYVSPEQTTRVIDTTIREIFKMCPLVLIDVRTGRLCGAAERTRIFKAETIFKELVSSKTATLDKGRVMRIVTKFFRYVTLSHVWGGKEPSFQEVKVVNSVWDLDSSPLNEKLCKFCELVRNSEEHYRWAWSDTCCIDKTASTVLNESLMSMYKWYEDSAETLVYLESVDSPSSPGDLTKSLWMMRSWTLQELLAPKVIRFYDRNWRPYLNDTRVNHKESPEIMRELAAAVQLAPGTIVKFRPDDLGVREKLRLAATRNATVEEDLAYSLIGIFSSDIRPHYGEREAALGHLLEEIVARSSEVIVLAWAGKSSKYNSCLPASLVVYKQMPCTILPIKAGEIESRVEELRSALSVHKARTIHKRIARLPPARFANRRLHLSCIVFPVKRLGVQHLGNNHSQGNRYLAKVSGLGKVEFVTTDLLPLQEPRRVVFVHPWIQDIRGGDVGSLWADEPESDSGSSGDRVSDVGSSNDDTDAGSAAAPAPLSAVPQGQLDDFSRALLMIARLSRPFAALMLLEQADGLFKRVASGNEIIVKLVRDVVSLKDVRARVVEVR